jgi:hypothetical protein
MNFPIVNETAKRCINFGELNCLYEEYKLFYTKKNLINIDRDCPHECNTMNYLTQTSSVIYPSRAYYELLKTSPVIRKHYEANLSKLTYEDLSSKVLMLNVHYKSLSYTRTYQTPAMSPLELISNFGGNLGKICETVY